MNSGEHKSKGFIRFFSNPVVGVIGSLASVIGLVLAVYFYFHSSRSRDLTYLIQPTRTVVVRSGQSSRLSVLLDGKSIANDITAAQIAFWNNGEESIRREHVLEPFTVRVGAPIIDARIRIKSRNIVNLVLDQSRLNSGELRIAWNILEHNDGGVVQIIFAGQPNTKIYAGATVEGQAKISSVIGLGDQISPPISTHALAGLAMIMVVLGVITLRKKYREERLQFYDWIIGAGFPIAMIVLVSIMEIALSESRSPFGF